MKKELTQELIKDLKNLIAPENVEKFDELMGIDKPMFRKEDFITGDKEEGIGDLRRSLMVGAVKLWGTISGQRK